MVYRAVCPLGHEVFGSAYFGQITMWRKTLKDGKRLSLYCTECGDSGKTLPTTTTHFESWLSKGT